MNIEELAFKNRKTLAYLNAIDLLNIIEFLQEDRKQWIEQFTKTHNESIDIQRENQELKEQNKKEFADYIKFKKEQYDEYLEKINKLIKENQELKKQLENNSKINVSDHKYASTCEDKVIILETQQKEFIKYLEDEKDRLARECSNIYEDSLGHTRLVNADIFDEVNEILQKYKSIIGDKDE